MVPLAVLLGASLQGCMEFAQLPPSVQIALGHACAVKVDETITDVAESEKTLGFMGQTCDELDEAKLKQFEVDCEEFSKRLVKNGAVTECEETVAKQGLEQCEKPSKDCKSGIDAGVKNWTLAKPDVSEGEVEEEKKEGSEALLGLWNECHKQSKNRLENPPADDDPVATACSAVSKDNLTAMGIDESHCKKYIVKEMTDWKTMVCIGWCLSNPPEGQQNGDEEVTLEVIQKVVGNFMSQPEDAIQGSEGLRLYAESAVKSKRWPKLKTWSSKMATLGGVTLAALIVFVIVGVKRRSRHVEVEGDQMLMSIE